MKVQVGMVFKTNEGCLLEVISYINFKNVLVKFLETGNTATLCAGNILTGKVKNPMYKSVLGVGFVGIGPHKVSVNKINTREYKYWFQMMRRCYEESSPAYKTYGALGIYVDPQWHNFQEFAEWCQWQPEFENEGWQLDKDILSPQSSKFYSPQTCCFVPRDINSMFKTKKPVGFNSRLQVMYEGKFIKTCRTAEEASSLYVSLKLSDLKKRALKYREDMSDRLYEFLMGKETV